MLRLGLGRVSIHNSVERLPIKKISSGNTISSPMHSADIGDQYFGAVFIPQQPQDASLVTLRYGLEVPRDPQQPDKEKTKVEGLGAAMGNLAARRLSACMSGQNNCPS